MATNEWAPGTTLRPKIVNVTFDEKGVVNHVGIGYLVVAPTGRPLLESGWTWTPPSGHGAALQSVMTALLKALELHEGIDTVTFTAPPVDPRQRHQA